MPLVNVGFYRYFWKDKGPNKGKKRTEVLNAQNIEVKEPWDGNHAKIREELRAHMPEGDGWRISGYCNQGYTAPEEDDG